uniref:Uncharacterized protein n=1 Tax=Oryza brachyantha TaxID=4533 RepID=J3LQV0_ORYBR
MDAAQAAMGELGGRQVDELTSPAIPSLSYSTMTACLPHFRKLLADLASRSALDVDSVSLITCVLADNLSALASTLRWSLEARHPGGGNNISLCSSMKLSGGVS